MWTMNLLHVECKIADCKSRATCRIQNGETVDGDYCANHGKKRLWELTKEEAKKKA